MSERPCFKSGRGFGFKSSVEAAFETASLISVGKAFAGSSVYLRGHLAVSVFRHSGICVIKRALEALD